MTEAVDTKQFLAMTAEIVAAHVGSNTIPREELGKLVRDVHSAVIATARGELPAERPTPAVPIERSVQPDHIVCLECGTNARLLKRHLQIRHGLTP